MRYSLDIKRTFTAGLWQVQNRLHRRYYVQATTLAEDIAMICKKNIEAVAARLPSEATVGSAEYNSQLKEAIHEVKDRKKLAKRIIKAIQPQLEIAVRAEADLLQKSPDKMVADLELVLEGCIDISPEALLGPTRHGTADPTVAVQSIEGADTADDNVDVNQQISVEAEAADSTALAESADVDMLDEDEDAPGEPDDGDAYASITPAEGETPGTTTKPTTEEPPAAQASETPPVATEYAAASNHLPQPPTPPVSNPGAGSIISQDLAPTSSGVPSVAPPGSFLTGGGKPWYLENYNPKTGTFEEPPPPPPPAAVEVEEEEEVEEVEVEVEKEKEKEKEDVARATSDEELSEIDDEEMRDLEEGVGEEMGAGKKVEKTTPRKAKAKKRKRAY
jgi:NuA3 HAT complex component NTO1